MSTCRCCGQHVEAAAQTPPPSDVLRVDDTVLALCNTAFELARERGHAHVEIAHAVLAIAMSDTGAQTLVRHGGAQELGRAADDWLSSWAQMRAPGDALSTSAELKQMLRMGEDLAQRAGRSHASLDDVLAALTSGSGVLWSAAFWSEHAREPDSDRSARRDEGVASMQQSAPQAFVQHHVTPVTATTPAAAQQPSLLDRDYAWLRDMKRATSVSGTQTTARTVSAPETAPATAAAGAVRVAATSAANAHVSLVAATPRTRGPRERDAGTAAPGGGARVMHLFASGTQTATAEPSKPAARTRDDEVSHAILQRLETQERTLTQRLDTQQRMIAELAEAFARSMRDLAQARSEAAAGFAHASAQEPRAGTVSNGERASSSASGSSESSTGSSHGSSQRKGARRSRSTRTGWRRQSWSAWRRRQSQAAGEHGRTSAEHGSNRAWSGWPDRVREPRAEREPRPERDPRAELKPREISMPAPVQSAPPFAPPVSLTETAEPNEREKRFYLALDDHIEKAPSIGPRSAALLNAVGVMTVRDLLTCDTADVAARLHNRYITADRLAQWQAQSRLVCMVPWLRGTHAQLLAGAGFDTLEKIIAADASSVCAAILKFAATRDGMSVLRSSPPPGEDWVVKRLEHARAAEPERVVA